MAQNPPMAFPVIDDGVCVPYPTKTRKIIDMNERYFLYYLRF